MGATAIRRSVSRMAVLAALLLVRATSADVLPDDRADLFYSKYSGGGMDITGESVLVRKKITENFAVEANYFVDKVSGASIDVLSQASQIKDERKQKSGTIEYVHDKTTYSLSYINSVENDYKSNTTSFSLKQDMFGDLTTLTLGYTHTDDGVGENNGGVIAWLGHAQSIGYDVGVSQILTKNLIAGLNVNVITDNGYLANPYRSYRYLDSGNAKGYSLASQIYPDTRTSTAIQTEAKYYLPYGASSATPTNSITPTRSPTFGSWRGACAFISRITLIFTATCTTSPANTISWRAIRTWRRDKTPPSGRKSLTRSCPTVGRCSNAPPPLSM
jgi:hypothetical protein